MSTSSDTSILPQEGPVSANPYLKTFDFHEVDGMPVEAFSFQTPAWYVLFALLGLIAVYYLWRRWQRWQADAWRREALAALAEMRQQNDIQHLPALLKASALKVFPREVVAALTGAAWLDFLNNSTTTEDLFHPDQTGAILLKLAYQPQQQCSVQEKEVVFAACELWLKNVQPACSQYSKKTQLEQKHRDEAAA